MYDYDVHEALYENCKIHGTFVKDSGPRAKPIYSETLIKIRNFSFFLFIYI